MKQDDNKRDWKGFCEIESDPVGQKVSGHYAILIFSQALFTSLLRKIGVQGIKVQEIVSFDDEVLCGVP